MVTPKSLPSNNDGIMTNGFRSEQIKLGLTRSDMIEWTELSHNRLPQQPLPSYLVKQQVEGRYKLSSRRGDSKPLREIPGIREELKRNPGTSGFLAARKRKGEDEQNITQKHLARGNSAASSSYEPSYHHSTAASSTDTRHNKTRSEVTSSSKRIGGVVPRTRTSLTRT